MSGDSEKYREMELDSLRAAMIASRVKEAQEAGRSIGRYLKELLSCAHEAQTELMKVEITIKRLQNMVTKLTPHAK